MFILHQQINLPTDQVGRSAEIIQLTVGDIMVEAISGSWFSAAGSNQLEWIPDAPVHTFRWQKDGFTFTLQFLVGDTFSLSYLSRDDMQAVVEMVIGTRSELPEKVDLNNLASVETVEQVITAQLLAPTLLPEGFVFERVVYEPENKCAIFIYRPKDTAGSMNHPSLVIYQILKNQANSSGAGQEQLPPEAIEQVTIGSTFGTFRGGAIVDGVYDPDSVLSLHWEIDDLNGTMNYISSADFQAQLEKADLIETAEGLRRGSTVNPPFPHPAGG